MLVWTKWSALSITRYFRRGRPRNPNSNDGFIQSASRGRASEDKRKRRNGPDNVHVTWPRSKADVLTEYRGTILFIAWPAPAKKETPAWYDPTARSD